MTIIVRITLRIDERERERRGGGFRMFKTDLGCKRSKETDLASAFQRFFFFLEHALAFFFFSSGSMHYSGNPQTSFFKKNFIKNGFHGTIHIFKNYFVTVFSVFSKINNIQTYPRCYSQYTVLPVSINRMKTKRGGLITICNNYLQP